MNEAPDDMIMVRLPGDLLRALDRFAEEHGSHEGRPQVVVTALREWAHARGYLSEPGEEGIRPEDLSAANDG
jgi:metal-responsive CopG/Arc/MetJ family transcriptional regulator